MFCGWQARSKKRFGYGRKLINDWESINGWISLYGLNSINDRKLENYGKREKPREAPDKIMPDFAGVYLMKRFTCIYHLFYKWLVVEEWGFRLKYSYLY